MGTVTKSLDRRLAERLIQVIPFEVLCATGTFQGNTPAALQDLFPRVYSIEWPEPLFQEAHQRLAGLPNVELRRGDSRQVLAELGPALGTASVCYWLNACGDAAEETAAGLSQCPLLEELTSIGTLNTGSVVVIDNARRFLGTLPVPQEASQWPAFHEVLSGLRGLSEQHRVAVVNDCLLFYPPILEDVLRGYAGDSGIDGGGLVPYQEEAKSAKKRGVILDQAAQISELRSCLATTQSELAQVKLRLAASENDCIDKDRVIRELSRALWAYRCAHWVLSPVQTVKAGAAALARRFGPRIGNLNQYPPRPLRLPRRYVGTVPEAKLPSISLVTPSFNQGRFLERTLCSVLDQGYPKLEYRLQDGGSQDGTRMVLERYGDRLTRWVSAPDDGQSHAINLGFANTSGEIMAWLNADDLLLPGALACVADYFANHPDVDVVYGDRILIDDQDQEVGHWILPKHVDWVLSWADFVPQETLFWRRDIWERSGGAIDESFRFAMDWDLLVRFRDAGAVFAHIPRFLGGFRVHPQQKTSAEIGSVGMDEMDRIRDRIHGRRVTRAEIHRALIPYLTRHVARHLLARAFSRVAPG